MTMAMGSPSTATGTYATGDFSGSITFRLAQPSTSTGSTDVDEYISVVRGQKPDRQRRLTVTTADPNWAIAQRSKR